MAVPRKRGDSWRVEWRRGGRGGARESTTWSTDKRALQAAAIVKAHGNSISADQVYDAILGRSPADLAADLGPTVREWADIWLRTRTRISPGQRRRYRQQLDQRILPALGHLRLREVRGAQVADLLQRLADRYAPTTVTRYFTAVHSMFAYAVAEHELDDNPARRTDFVRDLLAHDDTGDDERHVYLTPEEYNLIWWNAPPAARDVMDVLLDTGMRWSEATAARVDAFVSADVRQRTRSAQVKVHRAWKLDEKGGWYLGIPKGRKRRTITVGATLVDGVIRRLVAGQSPDALLLRAPQGGRLGYSNFVNRCWNPAVDAAMRCPLHPPQGVVPNRAGRWPKGAVSTCDCPGRLRQRPTVHCLRHSHAAMLIAAGQPIAAISRRLGHATTAITEQVYASILPQLDDALADALDAVRTPLPRQGDLESPGRHIEWSDRG